MTIRTYNELVLFATFKERFDYLLLKGSVGDATFGYDRYINQKFYASREWKQIRHFVIVRDGSCDLGISNYGITSELLIHHMNPVTKKALMEDASYLLNPDYLITTTKLTHNAIHFGNESYDRKGFVPRKPGDTKLW